MEDRQITHGQTLEVPITSLDVLVALQATWQFDGLELLEILPGSQMSDEDFHVSADATKCSMAWIGEENKPAFSFRFRANRSGYLSDMLDLSDALTPVRAYTQDEQGA